MRNLWTWIAVVLLLAGAVMIVADVGATGLWIAVIAVGIAVVAVDAHRRQRQHHA
jgi:drug/metabolite transporter (DMT)-like permease